MGRMGINTLGEVILALRGTTTVDPTGLKSRLNSITEGAKALYSMDPGFCVLIKEECSGELSKIEDILGGVLVSQDSSLQPLRKSAERFWDAIDGRFDTEERKLERDLNAEMLKAGSVKK